MKVTNIYCTLTKLKWCANPRAWWGFRVMKKTTKPRNNFRSQPNVVICPTYGPVFQCYMGPHLVHALNPAASPIRSRLQDRLTLSLFILFLSTSSMFMYNKPLFVSLSLLQLASLLLQLCANTCLPSSVKSCFGRDGIFSPFVIHYEDVKSPLLTSRFVLSETIGVKKNKNKKTITLQ